MQFCLWKRFPLISLLNHTTRSKILGEGPGSLLCPPWVPGLAWAWGPRTKDEYDPGSPASGQSEAIRPFKPSNGRLVWEPCVYKLVSWPLVFVKFLTSCNQHAVLNKELMITLRVRWFSRTHYITQLKQEREMEEYHSSPWMVGCIPLHTFFLLGTRTGA